MKNVQCQPRGIGDLISCQNDRKGCMAIADIANDIQGSA